MSKNEENLVDRLKASIRSSEENRKNNDTEPNQVGNNESNEFDKEKNQKITYSHILASSLVEVVLIELPKMFLISFLFMFIWNNALVENVNQVPEIDYTTSIIIYALASLLQRAR